jgi:hypothetical protein
MTNPNSRRLTDSKLELRKFFIDMIWIAVGVLAFIYLLWTEMRTFDGY